MSHTDDLFDGIKNEVNRKLDKFSEAQESMRRDGETRQNLVYDEWRKRFDVKQPDPADPSQAPASMDPSDGIEIRYPFALYFWGVA